MGLDTVSKHGTFHLSQRLAWSCVLECIVSLHGVVSWRSRLANTKKAITFTAASIPLGQERTEGGCLLPRGAPGGAPREQRSVTFREETALWPGPCLSPSLSISPSLHPSIPSIPSISISPPGSVVLRSPRTQAMQVLRTFKGTFKRT